MQCSVMRKSDVAIELAPYEGLSSYGRGEAIDEVIRLVNGIADSRVFPGCSYHRWCPYRRCGNDPYQNSFRLYFHGQPFLMINDLLAGVSKFNSIDVHHPDLLQEI